MPPPVIRVQSRCTAPTARVAAISSVPFTKIISIKQRHIEPPKPTRKPGASGWAGWNHYSGKPSNGMTWWNPKHPAGGALLSPCIFLFDPLLHATPTTGLLLAKDFFNTLVITAQTKGLFKLFWLGSTPSHSEFRPS